MTHHLFRPVVSQPILGLSLDGLVHKVYSLLRPFSRRIFLLDLRLFCQYFVPYLLPICADVRPETEYALKDDDTKCVVIHRNPVIATAHHFRCHIAWRSRSIAGILRLPDPSHAEIRYPQVAFFIKYDVLGL